MRSQPFINIKALLFFAALSVSGNAMADSTDYVQSPYRTEHCPWFEFNTFMRGYRADIIKETLDSLESKPRLKWTHQDSLVFAKTSLHSGNLDLSEHYYRELDPSDETEFEYWWDVMMIHVLKGEPQRALNELRRKKPGVVEYSRYYFMDRILHAKVEQSLNSKWYLENSVFNWEIDSSLNYYEDKELFELNVVNPVKNCSWVIHQFVRYIYENDKILSRSFFELGEVLEFYKAYSQAYIAYSIGKHYNRRDKEIINRIREVKLILLKKKYKIPNFRKYFPRIEFGRFDYELLREQWLAERADTLEKEKPLYRVEQEQIELPFPIELIYVVGFGFMFLMIAIFLRVRKKRH